MASVFENSVRTAKKRSKHPIDYRCPFCGSRNWSARTRTGYMFHKYKCSSCGCEFDKLRQSFIVIDESNDYGNVAECPVCGCLHSLITLHKMVHSDGIRVVKCVCEEMKLYMNVDPRGNRIVHIKCIHDLYMDRYEGE